LKKILENFQLKDIIDYETEFEKLWSKFDLDNVGFVRTNIFLRLLDYRVNLADEINADIQRLVSRSTAAGMIEQSKPSSSSSSKRSRLNKHHDDDKQAKHSAPPPTALAEPLPEITIDSNQKHINDENENLFNRELSTKFRTIVQQHRKMMKQLNQTDEFIPFLDRKVK
jgi:molecular chaperone DnaK (HSP70)